MYRFILINNEEEVFKCEDMQEVATHLEVTEVEAAKLIHEGDVEVYRIAEQVQAEVRIQWTGLEGRLPGGEG